MQVSYLKLICLATKTSYNHGSCNVVQKKDLYAGTISETYLLSYKD